RRAVASGASIDALAERLPDVEAPRPSSVSPEGDGLADQGLPEEIAADESGVSTTSPDEGEQGLEPQPEHSFRRNGGPAPRRGAAEERIAAWEAELSKAHDLLREQADRVEADSRRLGEQVVEVTRESDRLSEALDQVSGERDSLSEALDQVSGERD